MYFVLKKYLVSKRNKYLLHIFLPLLLLYMFLFFHCCSFFLFFITIMHVFTYVIQLFAFTFHYVFFSEQINFYLFKFTFTVLFIRDGIFINQIFEYWYH